MIESGKQPCKHEQILRTGYGPAWCQLCGVEVKAETVRPGATASPGCRVTVSSIDADGKRGKVTGIVK